jgi:hypothetical protein
MPAIFGVFLIIYPSNSSVEAILAFSLAWLTNPSITREMLQSVVFLAPAYINLSREKVVRLTNLVGTNRITAAAMSLQCGDCGVLLQSVEEAQAHAKSMSHSNFAESTPAGACGKLCRS